MKAKLVPISLRTITILSLLLSIWLILGNIYNFNNHYLLLIIGLALIIVCIFLPKQATADFIAKHPRIIITGLILIAITALAARFSFLAFEYSPTSDPADFYDSAIALANDNTILNPDYRTFAPYLFAYDLLLASAMKIFGTGLFAVIALNAILDIIAATLLYFLVKKISGKRQPAALAAILYFASPFNIIFSALSLPIVIVNTLIIASILIIYLTFQHARNFKKLLLFSLAAGIILSITNAFRPIAIIFIIAIAIYYLLHFIKIPTAKTAKSLGTSFAIIIASFFIANTGYTQLVSAATGNPPVNPANTAGWGLYVGSNFDSWGRFNIPDATTLSEIAAVTPSANDRLAIMKQKAIARYLSYSPPKLAELFIRKSITLGGDQYHSIYNLDSYPRLWQSETIIPSLYAICAIYSYFLIFFTARFFYLLRKQKPAKPVFIHFLSLCFLGLFSALLLVEVANRYFIPLFIFLTIFAALAVHTSFPPPKPKKLLFSQRTPLRQQQSPQNTKRPQEVSNKRHQNAKKQNRNYRH